MQVLLSVGGNLGDRRENLRRALALVAADTRVRVVSVSNTYETTPLGVVNQPDFINLAAAVETDLAPADLLEFLKTVERALGRVAGERWGARPVDLDIVLCGDLVLDTPVLTVPHPEFRKRAFVLSPLAEIAPDARDPVSGRTIAELARAPEAQGEIRCIGPL